MDLLLIGGVSGSGKSVALAALEDSGYHAINNLPPSMIVDTRRRPRAKRPGPRGGRARRQDRPRTARPRRCDRRRARGAGWTVRFLYLDAKTDTLVKRFSETRRRHPFSQRRAHADRGDRARARAARADARRRLRVRHERPARRRRCAAGSRTSSPSIRRKLTILFESFGFKHGVPLDADLVFDVRCLPNPHYEEALAPLTGTRRSRSSTFLEAAPEVERMYGDIYHFVASWLPDYARDNRNYLTVAIGCTGGRHRSVYLVERLARAFAGALPGAGAPSRALTNRDHARSRSPSPARRACRSACACSNASSPRAAASISSTRRPRRSSPSRNAHSRMPTQPREAARLFRERYGAAEGQIDRVRARGLDRAGRVRLESRRRDGDVPVQHGHARRDRARPRRQPDRARGRRDAEGAAPAGAGAARDAAVDDPPRRTC